MVCCALTNVSDGGDADVGGDVSGGVGFAVDDVVALAADASSGGMVSTTSPSAGAAVAAAGDRCANTVDGVAMTIVPLTIIPMSAARDTTLAAPLLHDRNHFATRPAELASRAGSMRL
jgi:hypothetical protein